MGQPGLWVENARLGRNRGRAGEYGGGGEAVARVGWMTLFSSTDLSRPTLLLAGGQASRCPPYGSDVRRGTLLLGEDLAAKPSFVPRAAFPQSRVQRITVGGAPP